MKKICLVLAILILIIGCIQQQTTKPIETPPTVKEVQKTQPTPIVEPLTAPENKTEGPPLINITEKNETKLPELKKGIADPYFEVEKYDPQAAWNWYTLFGDNHDTNNPRIIEVNMNGEVVWEYKLPAEFSGYTNPGFDVEPLANGNVQFVVPKKGIFEVDKSGNIVWEYRTEKISHDADRLSNGNILFVYGNEDKKTDAQVQEITPDGKVVWSWYAKNYFDKASYSTIYDQGWSHTNAVLRMDNGNTLISHRNFNMLIEVNKEGQVVDTIGESFMHYQHDPVFLTNGNLLFANHDEPNEVMEINPKTDEILWKFTINSTFLQPVRDANRLPNGNTLITGTSAIIEITPDGKPVWVLKLKNVELTRQTATAKGFYKAERIEKIIGEN